jgi:hypothetical protein
MSNVNHEGTNLCFGGAIDSTSTIMSTDSGLVSSTSSHCDQIMSLKQSNGGVINAKPPMSSSSSSSTCSSVSATGLPVTRPHEYVNVGSTRRSLMMAKANARNNSIGDQFGPDDDLVFEDQASENGKSDAKLPG